MTKCVLAPSSDFLEKPSKLIEEFNSQQQVDAQDTHLWLSGLLFMRYLFATFFRCKTQLADTIGHVCVVRRPD